MVTADEIGSIAIFAGLADSDRERLAPAAADITLAPGEYAAHEGGTPRALVAVLDGKIDAVKLSSTGFRAEEADEYGVAHRSPLTTANKEVPCES